LKTIPDPTETEEERKIKIPQDSSAQITRFRIGANISDAW
jgi:hypothetical protein